jgi:hypothetical protein
MDDHCLLIGAGSKFGLAAIRPWWNFVGSVYDDCGVHQRLGFGVAFACDLLYGVQTHTVYKNKRPYTHDEIRAMLETAPKLTRVMAGDYVAGYKSEDGTIAIMIPVSALSITTHSPETA